MKVCSSMPHASVLLLYVQSVNVCSDFFQGGNIFAALSQGQSDEEEDEESEEEEKPAKKVLLI